MAMIEYNVSRDDVLVLADFHAKTSPRLLRQARQIRYDAPIGFFGLGMFFSFTFESWHGIAIGGAVGIAWVVLVPRWLARLRRREILALYAEGRNHAVFGSHRVRITSAGLEHESAGSKSLVSWPTIERIGETESHLLLYVSAVTALIIPKRSIPVRDLANFIADVSAHAHIPIERP